MTDKIENKDLIQCAHGQYYDHCTFGCKHEPAEKEKWVNLNQKQEQIIADIKQQLATANKEIERLKDFEAYANYVHRMMQAGLKPSLFQIWQISMQGVKI